MIINDAAYVGSIGKNHNGTLIYFSVGAAAGCDLLILTFSGLEKIKIKRSQTAAATQIEPLAVDRPALGFTHDLANRTDKRLHRLPATDGVLPVEHYRRHRTHAAR